MNGQTRTLTVSDKLSRIEDDIEDVLDEAEDADPDSDEYEELDIQYKAHKVEQKNFQEVLEDLDVDDAEFVVRELSFGELMHVRDEVQAHSEDPQNPRQGLYQVRILDVAVDDQPDAMPDEPKDWSPTLAEWVYEEIDAMNTGVDEETLGNFSVEDALENRT